MLKLVNGELVRTVKGNFSYNSPENLFISVKWATIFYPYRFIFFNKIFFLLYIYLSRYEADENGNRASFKFGTGAANDNHNIPFGSGHRMRDKNGSKSNSYLPPTTVTKNDVNRTYLPPQ